MNILNDSVKDYSFLKCIIYILIVAHLHIVIILLKEMQIRTAFVTKSD